MKDLTLALFDHTLWFAGGIVLYLYLSLYKLYLHFKFGDPSYDVRTTFIQFLRKLSWPYFFSFLFKSNTHYPPLFEGYVKPRVRLTILNGLRLFLKPYIIVGLIWYFIDALILLHLDYEPLRVTLGGIQLLINYINKIPFINYLGRHDKVAFLITGLVFLYIPLFYKHQEKLNSFKDYAKTTLVYLAILSSISLFGNTTGKYTYAKNQQLSNLELRIRTIHDSIFLKLNSKIIRDNYLAALEQYQNDVESKLPKFKDSLNYAIDTGHFGSGIQRGLTDSVSTLTDTLAKQITLIAPRRYISVPDSTYSDDKSNPETVEIAVPDFGVDYPVSHTSIPPGESGYSKWYKRAHGARSELSYADYLAAPEKWNIADGERALKVVDAGIYRSSRSKLAETVDLISEFLLDVGLDKSLDAVKLKNLTFLQSILETVSKNTFVDQINSTIDRCLTKLGNFHKIPSQSEIADARGQLAMTQAPQLADYENQIKSTESTITGKLEKDKISEYKNWISEKVEYYIPDKFKELHDPITDFQSELKSRLLSQRPAELDRIYRAMSSTDDYLAQLDHLGSLGYIDKHELLKIKNLYMKSTICQFATSESDGFDTGQLLARLSQMSPKSTIDVYNATLNQEYPEFLENLKDKGLLSPNQFVDNTKSYYKKNINAKIESLTRTDIDVSTLKRNFEERLTNSGVEDLQKIYVAADGAENMFQWLTKMEERSLITEVEKNTFHELCTCLIPR